VTVEYPEANPHESGHVRAPGPDYFGKFRKMFEKVVILSSGDFDSRYQLWNYEDRTIFPSSDNPLKHSVPGKRHPDYVPICYKSA
jgi:hypothetical protein